MRILIALSTVLALASAASAATLTVTSDRATYFPGQTITLTIYGDNQGADSSTYSLYGRLSYDPALMNPGSVGVQTVAGPSWTAQEPLPQGDGFVEVFAQADFTFSGAAPNYPAVINTVTLIAQRGGLANLNWTADLSFFGILGAQPATSFIIFPEPSTGGLLGLGLLALAIRKRRKQ